MFVCIDCTACVRLCPYCTYTLFPSSNQLSPLGTEAPQALLTRGKHDITKLSSTLLSLFLSPFLYFSSSLQPPPHLLEHSRAEHSSDIIEGIWCKIRTPAKQVLDYLVMPPPPHSWFKPNFSNGKMNRGQILINRKICD